MKILRRRRRWVALVIVVLVVVATIRLLDQPLALESYRMSDPQTLEVVGYGAKTAWTRVTDVSETETTVTISVNSFEVTGFLPHSDAADRIVVDVRLTTPLGTRTVIDGSTGLPLAETS